MIKHIAALVSVAAVMLPSGANAATAVWNGDIGKSCTIKAVDPGRVVLSSADSIRETRLSSEGSGAPATLSVTTVGTTGSVGFVAGSASITRDGQELLVRSASITSRIRYDGTSNWVDVFQNTHDNLYGKQVRYNVGEGTSTLRVHTKSDAHLNQGKNKIIPGKYIVKTTFECKTN